LEIPKFQSLLIVRPVPYCWAGTLCTFDYAAREALIRANKRFDLLTIPGGNHGAGGSQCATFSCRHDSSAFCWLEANFCCTSVIASIFVFDVVFIFGQKRQRLGDKAANTIVIQLYPDELG
jgi:hypothetical protein